MLNIIVGANIVVCGLLSNIKGNSFLHVGQKATPVNGEQVYHVLLCT